MSLADSFGTMMVAPGSGLIFVQETVSVLTWKAAFEAEPAVCGWKGYNLARLARYGFAVPDGGVLGVEAYRSTIRDPARLSQLQAAEESALPANVSGAIASLFREQGLEDVPLAVRSSATAEDSDGSSFADIYRSVLQVRGLAYPCSALVTSPDLVHSAAMRGVPSLPNRPRSNFSRDCNHRVGRAIGKSHKLVDLQLSLAMGGEHCRDLFPSHDVYRGICDLALSSDVGPEHRRQTIFNLSQIAKRAQEEKDPAQAGSAASSAVRIDIDQREVATEHMRKIGRSHSEAVLHDPVQQCRIEYARPARPSETQEKCSHQPDPRAAP